MKTNTKHWASITAGILSLAGYASATSLGSEKYTYDASGNITEKTIDGIVTRMNYDKSNRISDRQTIGQNKETNYYDAASRPIAEKAENGQSIRSLNYGYGDKVIEVQNSDLKTGFYYNAEGQLVGKKTNNRTSTYAWDSNVLSAKDSEAFTNESHISGGVPILSGEKEIITSDYLGNTLSTGHDFSMATAFGEGLENARYTGKPFIEELDNYVFLHRNYSAKINRWITTDPSGFPDGLNNMSYVNNDPLSNLDIFGLVCKDTSHAVTATVYNSIIVSGTIPNSNPQVTETATIDVIYKYDFVKKPWYVSAQQSGTTPGHVQVANEKGSIPKDFSPVTPNNCMDPNWHNRTWQNGEVEANCKITINHGGTNYPISGCTATVPVGALPVNVHEEK
jgi:RHS repeat-associated protein